MNRIALIVALLIVLPLTAAARMPVVADSLAARFDGRTLAPVEGIWLIADGSQLMIERDNDNGYVVTRLHGDDLRLAPGTRVGSIVPENLQGTKYRAQLATTVNGNGKADGLRTFEVTTADETSPERGTLTLRPRGKFKLNLWLLYRMFVTVSVKGNNEPVELHAIRLYPNPAFSADFPLAL